MWFITFSTKHFSNKQNIPTLAQVSLIKVKTKTLQLCLSEFCDHSQLLFIVLHSQVIRINLY